MTAAERSFIGLAKQTGKGTKNVTDNLFSYFLFREGGAGPNNVTIPLDQEIGGGAMLRGMVRVGVTSAGVYQIIPRPTVLGDFLLGALGFENDVVVLSAGQAFKHTFVLPTDQFDAPYWTLRSAPGDIWGEEYMDMRVASLNLNWKAADYLRGSVAFLGGLPATAVTMTGWSPLTYLDSGPQFLAPTTTIELPTGSALKVLSGSINMGVQIPLDEQWITGSYSPDDFQINQRAFSITMAVKVVDHVLYDKFNYDPDGGAAWTCNLLRESDMKLLFNSDQLAYTAYPYSITVKASGCNQASGFANVIWSATPIALRAGRQVTMAITGVFINALETDPPIKVELVNKQAACYDIS
jgi:hypothetical protein